MRYENKTEKNLELWFCDEQENVVSVIRLAPGGWFDGFVKPAPLMLIRPTPKLEGDYPEMQPSYLRDKWERLVWKLTGRWPDSKVERRLALSDARERAGRTTPHS